MGRRELACLLERVQFRFEESLLLSPLKLEEGEGLDDERREGGGAE